jgi:hypothetical protein
LRSREGQLVGDTAQRADFLATYNTSCEVRFERAPIVGIEGAENVGSGERLLVVQ